MLTLRLVINFKAAAAANSWKCLMAPRAMNNNFCTHQVRNETKIERLKERSLLSVTGQDAAGFLQGLITNDMNNLLKEKQQSLYTMFLNVRGRVIHDAIIYKSHNQNSFLVETDITSIQALHVHLSLFKNHNYVAIENEEHNYSVWAVYNPSRTEKAFSALPPSQGLLDGNGDLSFLEEINFGDDVIISYDPRILSLGTRIIAPTELDIHNLIKLGGFHLTKGKQGEFKLLRYKLGIGEGINEFLYGRHYASELNCDYLNALSNKKDDYLGKTFSSFKTERRMMPIKLLSNQMNIFALDSPLIDLQRKKKTPLGHLRGVQGFCGIAVVRVPNLEEEKNMRIGPSLIQCIKPFWWPDFGKTMPSRQNISFA